VWSLTAPSAAEIRTFLTRQAARPFSYPGVGLTRTLRPGPGGAEPPAGFDLDHNRTRLGAGEEDFAAARRAIARWLMFPRGWTRVVGHGEPELDSEGTGVPAFREGTLVAVVARALGVYWRSACRVVYVLGEGDGQDGARRYGFAYGTLPGHVEHGEERFSVELLPDGSVWYDLLAFSRPHYWAARLAKPLARRLQRRFVRDSLDQMRRAVAEARGGSLLC
jgi:uncharacterized protein (UPF0548 family)